MSSREQLSNFEVLKIAAAAPADPRTVRRVFRGEGSAMARERVLRAARELGFAPSDPRAAQPPTCPAA